MNQRIKGRCSQFIYYISYIATVHSKQVHAYTFKDNTGTFEIIIRLLIYYALLNALI